eukprot:14470909-Alexandrium_andersonii.AAC.1
MNTAGRAKFRNPIKAQKVRALVPLELFKTHSHEPKQTPCDFILERSLQLHPPTTSLRGKGTSQSWSWVAWPWKQGATSHTGTFVARCSEEGGA